MNSRSTEPSTSTHASQPASPTSATSPYRRVSASPSAATGSAASTMPPLSASQIGNRKKPHQPEISSFEVSFLTASSDAR
jgi:hypothetical protein